MRLLSLRAAGARVNDITRGKKVLDGRAERRVEYQSDLTLNPTTRGLDL